MGSTPDIASVDVVLDSRCTISVGATLGDYSLSPTSLYTGEMIAFLIDTDGDSATGDALGSDRALVTYGDSEGLDLTRIGS